MVEKIIVIDKKLEEKKEKKEKNWKMDVENFEKNWCMCNGD